MEVLTKGAGNPFLPRNATTGASRRDPFSQIPQVSITHCMSRACGSSYLRFQTLRHKPSVS